jgi:hypothetical protein
VSASPRETHDLWCARPCANVRVRVFLGSVRARSADSGADAIERTWPARSARDSATSLDALARRPDDAIDVALGAVLIARDVYGNLAIRALLAQLDALAAPLALRNSHHERVAR